MSRAFDPIAACLRSCFTACEKEADASEHGPSLEKQHRRDTQEKGGGAQMGPTGRGTTPSEVTDSTGGYFIHSRRNLTARVTQGAAGTDGSHPGRGEGGGDRV